MLASMASTPCKRYPVRESSVLWHKLDYLSCASLPGLKFDTWEIACLHPSKPVLKARVLPVELLQVNLDYQDFKKLLSLKNK